ncbi:MAG: shikimate kinase [Alphaproteobacteria bacterium]|nr:shikimate kinase [Alphaproteobacteria bacterium]
MKRNTDIFVLVGLMGCGKTRVGIELAKLLTLPFFDADREIEQAAGMPIPDIFSKLGESEFRRGEKKVLDRLLNGQDKVIASGGGAFIQDEIRNSIKNNSISIWLKADINVLLERVLRSDHRPLLHNVDPEEKMRELMTQRYPIYAEADITVDVKDQSPRRMARMIQNEIETLRKRT